MWYRRLVNLDELTERNLLAIRTFVGLEVDLTLAKSTKLFERVWALQDELKVLKEASLEILNNVDLADHPRHRAEFELSQIEKLERDLKGILRKHSIIARGQIAAKNGSIECGDFGKMATKCDDLQ